MEKLDIDYPCHWEYKIIGSDAGLIKEMVTTIFRDLKYQFSESNQSRTGKYISFSFSVKVHKEEERQKIFKTLKNIPSVKIVL